MNKVEPKYHAFKVARTAHVYTSGNLTDNTQYIWLACHGYGQSADRFIYKFEHLDADKHFVIAPEGLSRFYWNGVKGDVVASWMTSKNRLNEIDDYLQYLNTVLLKFIHQNKNQGQLIFFGFSQGCATLMRFLAEFQPAFKAVILWAGSLPKEINYLESSEYWGQGKMHLIYGHNDEYLSEEFLQQEIDFITGQNLNFTRHVFEGTHRIDKKVLMDRIDQILHK